MATTEFLQARKVALELQITAMQNALTFFAENGAAQSYTLDTGQNRQTVQRASPAEMNRVIKSLWNQLDDVCRRLNLTPTGDIVRPAF